MKSMKTTKLTTALLTIALMISAAGCSKSPTESNKHELVGSWSLESLEVAWPSDMYRVPASEISSMNAVSQYLAGGNGVYTSTDDTVSFSWAAEGNHLTITAASEASRYTYSVVEGVLEMQTVVDDTTTLVETWRRN